MQIFETIPGFKVAERVRTATEEIDPFQEIRKPREHCRFLFSIFSRKITTSSFLHLLVQFLHSSSRIADSRRKRGSALSLSVQDVFAKTVTKEFLRGTREGTLIVLLEGKQVQAAVRDSNSIDVLLAAWSEAVTL